MLRLLRTEKKADWDFFHEVPRFGRGTRNQFMKRGVSSTDEASLFHYSEHPFFRHALARGFVVLHEDRPVARVAAFVDMDFVRERKEKVGFLGFFSHVTDCPAAAAGMLLVAARDWLQSEGMTAFLAPVEQSFWSGWGWTREEESFWHPALAGVGANQIVRVVDYKVDLEEFTWPVAIESRAEIAAQATRARLIESDRSSSLRNLVRPLERVILPSAQEKRVRKDLQILELVNQSTLNCEEGSRVLPWDRVLNPADWLAWREHTRGNHIDLDIEVAGALAGWVCVLQPTEGSSGQATVSHIELSGAYKDFDLLPWLLISVTRWALDNGVKSLEWMGAEGKSQWGSLLKTAFPHGMSSPRYLIGGAWARPSGKRT